jgi:hypothetical protein
MLSAKAPDVALKPDDVLFVPGSLSKVIAKTSAQAVISIGTG